MCLCIKMYVLLTILFVVAYVKDVRSETFCRVGDDAWMQYCFEPGYSHGLRRCNTFEPEGVILRPGCSASSSYNQSIVPRLCVAGDWKDVDTCKSGNSD